jgi:hypothetical protein
MGSAMGRFSPISSVIYSKFSLAFTITYITADTLYTLTIIGGVVT